MSKVDVLNQLAWIYSGVQVTPAQLYAIVMDAVREIAGEREITRTLRAEVAQHARRASLVAEWTAGIATGKRYTVTAGGREWFACTRGGDDKYFSAGVRRASEGIEELAETSAARAAAYMLAVSDQWQEVEP